MPMNKLSHKNDDYIHGALALAHMPNMRRVSRDELAEEIAMWRSIHGTPPDISSRDQAFEYKGLEFTSLDLSDIDLSKMDLRFLRLTHCNLSGTKLNSTNLGGAFLFGCDLSKIDSWFGHFRHASLRQCYITASRFIHGRFEGTSFAHSNLENTKLINAQFNRETWFYQTRLYCTDFSEAYLERVNLAEASTLFGVRLYLAQLEGTVIDFDMFEGKLGEELAGEFVKAAKAYLAIKANLETRGFYLEAGKAYVKERQMKKAAKSPWNARRCYGAAKLGDKYEFSKDQNKMALTQLGTQWWQPRLWLFYISHTKNWISDWFVELLCNYGESIGRVLFWIGAILIVIGPLLTWRAGGLDWSSKNETIYQNLPNNMQKQTYAYFQYILYMIDTFTTADFSKMEPANDVVRLLSGFFALVGIFLAGLLGFVTGNRIRRS